MIRIIMSHWASYLFLGWVATIVVANLWLREEAYRQTEGDAIFAAAGGKAIFLELFQGEPELSHRDR